MSAELADGRRFTWLAALLLATHAVLAVIGAWSAGCTKDEFHYLNSGRILLRHGWASESTLYQGPIGLAANQLFVGTFPAGGYRALPEQRGVLFRGRLGTLPFALALGWLVFAWARTLWGPRGGVLALAVHALNPIVLGHASLLLVDLQLSALVTACAWFLWRALEVHRARDGVLAGAMLGLALATKYSALLVAGPVLLVVALAAWRGARGLTEGRRAGRAAGALALAVLAALLALHAGYGFRGGLADPGGPHASELARSVLGTPLGGLARLLPGPFLAGVDFQLVQSERDWGVFLLGRFREGSWLYYPVALLAKTPELVLLAALATLVAWCALARRRELPRAAWTALGAMLATGGVLLVYMSGFTRMQLGIRYVLPVLPLCAVLVGVLGLWLERVCRKDVVLMGALGAVALAGGVALARSWPDWIHDFNAASGGQARAYRIFRDSNADFGQHPAEDLAPLVARHGPLELLERASGPRFGRVVVDADGLRGRDREAAGRAALDWAASGALVDHLASSWWIFDVTPELLEARLAEEDDPWLRRDLALAYLGAGRLADAERHLAVLAPEAAATPRALLALERRAAETPGPGAVQALALAWREAGRPDRVLALAEVHPGLVPPALATQARLARLAEQRRHAELIAALDALEPGDPLALVAVGDLWTAGKIEEALAAFHRVEARARGTALESSPMLEEARAGLARVEAYERLLR